MTTKQYTIKDVQVGSQIITQDDMDLDLGWGTVNEIVSDEDKVLATYKDGETYEVEMWAVLDVLGPVTADTSAADTSADDKGTDTTKPTSTQPADKQERAAALNVNLAQVKPGTIVTFARSGTGSYRTFDRNRLWVVLNWTKNSRNQKVNIAPLNGLQPGEKWSYDYTPVYVAQVTPVNFRSYVYKKGTN